MCNGTKISYDEVVGGTAPGVAKVKLFRCMGVGGRSRGRVVKGRVLLHDCVDLLFHLSPSITRILLTQTQAQTYQKNAPHHNPPPRPPRLPVTPNSVQKEPTSPPSPKTYSALILPPAPALRRPDLSPDSTTAPQPALHPAESTFPPPLAQTQ